MFLEDLIPFTMPVMSFLVITFNSAVAGNAVFLMETLEYFCTIPFTSKPNCIPREHGFYPTGAATAATSILRTTLRGESGLHCTIL